MAIQARKTRIAAALDAILAAIENGSGFPGTFEVRTGAPPATVEDGDSGTLLAVCPWANDGDAAAFGATSDATLIAVANTDGVKVAAEDSILATDTAGHFRIKDYAGTVVMQGTVGEAAADMIVNSVNFVAGQPFTVVSCQLALYGLDAPYP